VYYRAFAGYDTRQYNIIAKIDLPTTYIHIHIYSQTMLYPIQYMFLMLHHIPTELTRIIFDTLNTLATNHVRIHLKAYDAETPHQSAYDCWKMSNNGVFHPMAYICDKSHTRYLNYTFCEEIFQITSLYNIDSKGNIQEGNFPCTFFDNKYFKSVIDMMEGYRNLCQFIDGL
jgi:hypothetical protein